MPFPGELESCSRIAARTSRQRRGDVRTSSCTMGSWRNDATLGIVSHTAPCSTCKDYTMHLFQHEFKRDLLYLNAVDCRDCEIAAKERALAHHHYNDYEDELHKLRVKIASLEEELDQQGESSHPHKRAHISYSRCSTRLSRTILCWSSLQACSPSCSLHH